MGRESWRQKQSERERIEKKDERKRERRLGGENKIGATVI